MGMGIGTGGMSVPTQYNPLEEPSPLGLKLRKSPSLLELIQMRISQANSPKASSLSKKDQKGTSSSGTSEKLKASNFPASILRIGTWEVYVIRLLFLFNCTLFSLIMTRTVLLLSV